MGSSIVNRKKVWGMYGWKEKRCCSGKLVTVTMTGLRVSLSRIDTAGKTLQEGGNGGGGRNKR